MYGYICLVGDPHIGTIKFPYDKDPDIITRLRLEALRKTIQYCLDNKCKYLVVLGDLFHSKSLLVHPSIIKELRLMFKYGAERGMSYLIIAGNHDMSSTHESSLHYLIDAHMVYTVFDACKFPIISVVDDFQRVVIVPYKAHTTAKESLLNEHTDASVQILLGHFSVHFNDAPHYIKNDPWSVDINWLISYCKNKGIKTVVLGHQHKYFFYERDDISICCLGSLSPTARDQQGYDYGNLAFVSLKDASLEIRKNVIGGYRYLHSKDVVSNLDIVPLLIDKDVDETSDIGIGCIKHIEESSFDISYSDNSIKDSVIETILGLKELIPLIEASSFITDIKHKYKTNIIDPFESL